MFTAVTAVTPYCIVGGYIDVSEEHVATIMWEVDRTCLLED
jgi:hypothetical protein